MRSRFGFLLRGLAQAGAAAPLVLAAIAALLSTPAHALVDFNVAVGGDFAGDFDVDTFEADANTGYLIAAEVMFDPIKKFEIGAGLEYGFPRDADAGQIEDLDYTHLYGQARWFLLGKVVRWYVTGRVGWTDVSADEIQSGEADGKETWSAGSGVELGKWLKLELLFNDFSGEIKGGSSGDADFDYQNYSTRVVFTLR